MLLCISAVITSIHEHLHAVLQNVKHCFCSCWREEDRESQTPGETILLEQVNL